MSNLKVNILDLDGSITKQKRVIESFRPEIVDLRESGPSCRAWINRKSRNELRRRLAGFNPAGITLVGSGDFHHISALLIEKISEECCVIVYDLHPDLDFLPPRFSCGSWVNIIARMNHVGRIVMFGPSSEDLDFSGNMTFNFSWFKSERVELYPYRHEPSKMLMKRLRTNRFISTNNRFPFQDISWKNLYGEDPVLFTKSVIDRLPFKKVYISIDKDCLLPESAVTNWEPGLMPLEWLLSSLRTLRDNAEIIGMDIIGDYSPIVADTAVKRYLTSVDHPDLGAIDEARATAINEETNIRILSLFRRQ